MAIATANITVSRKFKFPRNAVFAHWISPETRIRWEAGPDTGMRYDSFDTRAGGVEMVRVFQNTEEIGHMVQRIHSVAPDALVSTVEGHFGGSLTMVMIVSIAFVETESGCRLDATAQITDLSGTDPTSQHEAGWIWLLDRFESDIATYGVIAE